MNGSSRGAEAHSISEAVPEQVSLVTSAATWFVERAFPLDRWY